MRRTVFYSGHVQGVGFRRSVARVAHAYDVSGWVRNLPDGRVQVVAEAAKDQLDKFLEDVGEVLEANIRHCQSEETLATGEFQRFTVKL